MPLKNSDMNSNLTIAKEAKKLNEVKKGIVAESVPYNNEESGLSADNVQGAIDEVASKSFAVVDAGSDNLLLAYKLTSDRKEIAIPYTGPDIKNILRNKTYILIGKTFPETSSPQFDYMYNKMIIGLSNYREVGPDSYRWSINDDFLVYENLFSFRTTFGGIENFLSACFLGPNCKANSTSITIDTNTSDYNTYTSVSGKGCINSDEYNFLSGNSAGLYGRIGHYDEFEENYMGLHLYQNEEDDEHPNTLLILNNNKLGQSSAFVKDTYVIIAVGDEAVDKVNNHPEQIEFVEI